MFAVVRIGSACAIAAASLAAAAMAAEPAAPRAGSSAYALSARFTSGGAVTPLSPVAPVQGSLPGSYDTKAIVPLYNESLGIIGGTKQIATLTIVGQSLRTEAASRGFGIDDLSVSANDALGRVQMTLQLYPPPPGADVVPAPLLTVSASRVVASAYETEVVPQTPTVGSAASFGALSISGGLIGDKLLNFTGPAQPNTVLYDSPTVTITLNRQLRAGLISCGPACVFTPTSITADAVAIEVHNAKLLGDSVSGDILIGQTEAQIP